MLDMTTICSTWDSIICCYADDDGAGCDRDRVLSDGDELYNRWYQGLNDCHSKHSEKSDNIPLRCSVNDDLSKVKICDYLKYYCHDETANGHVNMQNGVCSNDKWTTHACCYQADGGKGCDRPTLLEEATAIGDKRYRVIGTCNPDHFTLVDRGVTTTPDYTTNYRSSTTTSTTQPPPLYVGETEVFIDEFDNSDDLSANWNVEVKPNPYVELQYYHWNNVKIEDGKLILTPKKEWRGHRQYTSGEVYSKYQFRYGRVEVVAKTPAGRGLSLW